MKVRNRAERAVVADDRDKSPRVGDLPLLKRPTSALMEPDWDCVALVRRAIDASGGLRKLSRELEWHSGAISEVLAGKVRLSPFRAIQCASVVGEDGERWMAVVMQLGSRTAVERRFWTERLNSLS